MDHVALIRRTIAEADRLVQGTTPDQLGVQTPCSEWSVRDLVNHITGGSLMFARCVEDGSVPDDELGQYLAGDNLGDDYKGAWSAASQRAIAAFERPGALDQTVTLPFGEMPAGVALQIAVFDVTTHACDLASVTDRTIADRELLDLALETGRQMVTPEMRTPGLFDAEQPCPADATAEQRLLAFAGRRI